MLLRHRHYHTLLLPLQTALDVGDFASGLHGVKHFMHVSTHIYTYIYYYSDTLHIDIYIYIYIIYTYSIYTCEEIYISLNFLDRGHRV